MSSRMVLGGLVVFCLIALAVPEATDKFYVQFATKVMIMAIFAMSLDLLVGYTGLVSLGHAAFFGLAGYLLAFSAPQLQPASLWVSLPFAMIICALFAAFVGFLTLRTSGINFIMVTLAIGQLLYFLAHDTNLAGGSDGIYIHIRPDATIYGWKPFDLDNFVTFYYFTLTLLVFTYLLLSNLVASIFGRVLFGIRQNEIRMFSIGYPTFRYKLVCFIISGALAGLAGYLSAAQFGFVSPEMLGWHLSGSVLMMVILGGKGTLAGPALGAFAILVLELVFQTLPLVGEVAWSKHWQLFMGITIVLVALILPHGLIGLTNRIFRKHNPFDE